MYSKVKLLNIYDMLKVFHLASNRFEKENSTAPTPPALPQPE